MSDYRRAVAVAVLRVAGAAMADQDRTAAVQLAFEHAAFAARRERLQREPRFVGRAHGAGVAILAASDTGNPYVFSAWGVA